MRTRPIKLSGLLVAVLTMSACAQMGKSGGNDVEVAAQRLVGQPVSTAIALFGKPDQGLGPSSYGSGGFYAWNRLQTQVGPEKIFVQTGQEYAGQKTTYVTMRGKGVSSIMPVGSEAVYRPTGYYVDETVIDYLCSITLFTDGQDLITKASVVDCNEKKK